MQFGGNAPRKFSAWDKHTYFGWVSNSTVV